MKEEQFRLWSPCLFEGISTMRATQTWVSLNSMTLKYRMLHIFDTSLILIKKPSHKVVQDK